MADWSDQMRSLMVQFNRSISETCYFLDAQFMDMKRSAISTRRGSNSLPAFIRVILKARFRYSLWDCLIPCSMLFIFRFLIILSVANILCWDMVFRKPILLILMRSQHRDTFLYLSSMTFSTFSIIIGSTCWVLWQSVFTCKYGTLGL